ncbi:MAG: hypothetical protein ACOX1P_30010 [Thermoguttaceae bacterium]
MNRFLPGVLLFALIFLTKTVVPPFQGYRSVMDSVPRALSLRWVVAAQNLPAPAHHEPFGVSALAMALGGAALAFRP